MLMLQHPKRAFPLKPGRVRPNIHHHAPRLNYPLDHKQKADFRVAEDEQKMAVSENNWTRHDFSCYLHLYYGLTLSLRAT